MESCVFCKIAAGDIPVERLYEDETTLAFPDAHPKAPGHTLLIPKAHHRWFQDLPDDVSDPLFRAAKRVARELKATCAADYVRLGIVGKDVPHVHVHLIPQKFADGGPDL